MFGESAGASLTWIMSTMSSAPSLMKAALAESRDGALFQYNTTYYQQGQQYAQALGCNLTDVSFGSVQAFSSSYLTDTTGRLHASNQSLYATSPARSLHQRDSRSHPQAGSLSWTAKLFPFSRRQSLPGSHS